VDPFHRRCAAEPDRFIPYLESEHRIMQPGSGCSSFAGGQAIPARVTAKKDALLYRFGLPTPFGQEKNVATLGIGAANPGYNGTSNHHRFLRRNWVVGDHHITFEFRGSLRRDFLHREHLGAAVTTRLIRKGAKK